MKVNQTSKKKCTIPKLATANTFIFRKYNFILFYVYSQNNYVQQCNTNVLWKNINWKTFNFIDAWKKYICDKNLLKMSIITIHWTPTLINRLALVVKFHFFFFKLRYVFDMQFNVKYKMDTICFFIFICK